MEQCIQWLELKLILFKILMMMLLLLKEQSVFVLPGQSFNIKNYFRIVICAPEKILSIAFDRLEEFCKKHYKN